MIGDQFSIDKEGRILDLKKVVPATFRRTLYSGCAVPQPSTFWTRNSFGVTGELETDLHYLMDYEYFLRMQARGVRFGVIRAPLAKFRLHGESKSVSEYQRSFWADFAKVQDRYLQVPFHGAPRESYRRGMKWLCRLQLYLLRMVTRGTVIPFQSTRARQAAQAFKPA